MCYVSVRVTVFRFGSEAVEIINIRWELAGEAF